MRLLRSGGLILVLAASVGIGVGEARADRVGGDPIAQGQELAKQGDFAGAVQAFLEAERQSPTPDTACLIGLAEHRRGEHGQSEQWFGLCHARATATTPVPGWAAAIEQELAKQLAGLASVNVRIEPPNPNAVVTLAGWDAPLHSAIVHLQPGHYVFHVQVAGGAKGEGSIDIAVGEARTVVLTPGVATTGHVTAVVVTPQPVPLPPPRDDRSHARVGTIVLATGIAALAVGGVLDVTLVRSRRADLHDVDLDTYEDRLPRYQSARTGTIIVVSVGAAAVITGLLLRHREQRPTAPQVGAIVGPDGGLITVGWSR